MNIQRHERAICLLMESERCQRLLGLCYLGQTRMQVRPVKLSSPIRSLNKKPQIAQTCSSTDPHWANSPVVHLGLLRRTLAVRGTRRVSHHRRKHPTPVTQWARDVLTCANQNQEQWARGSPQETSVLRFGHERRRHPKAQTNPLDSP